MSDPAAPPPTGGVQAPPPAGSNESRPARAAAGKSGTRSGAPTPAAAAGKLPALVGAAAARPVGPLAAALAGRIYAVSGTPAAAAPTTGSPLFALRQALPPAPPLGPAAESLLGAGAGPAKLLPSASLRGAKVRLVLFSASLAP